jgi:hypothetical protein
MMASHRLPAATGVAATSCGCLGTRSEVLESVMIAIGAGFALSLWINISHIICVARIALIDGLARSTRTIPYKLRPRSLASAP